MRLPLEVLLLFLLIGDILLLDPDIIRDLFGHLDFARHFNSLLFSDGSRHFDRHCAHRELGLGRGTRARVLDDGDSVPAAVSSGLGGRDHLNVFHLRFPDGSLDGAHLPPSLVLLDHFLFVADRLDLCVGLLWDLDHLGVPDSLLLGEFLLLLLGLGDPRSNVVAL